MGEREMSAIDALLPHRARTFTLNLPFPTSTNRIWRRGKHKGMYRSAEYRDWERKANGYILMQKPLMHFDLPCKVTIMLNEEAGIGDADNRIKVLLDFLQKIEVIKNDNLFRKGEWEWVAASQAPYGCRVIIRELDR